jgi:hypothetical protein
MNTTLTIIAFVAGGLLVLLLLLGFIAGLVRRRLQAELESRLPGRRVLRRSLRANFFGFASLGPAQLRGNGALVLLPEELYFLMAAPRREIRIPLERIIETSLVRSHLGKTIFRSLFHVAYHGGEGDDAVAWAVPDPQGWREAVELARGRQT